MINQKAKIIRSHTHPETEGKIGTILIIDQMGTNEPLYTLGLSDKSLVLADRVEIIKSTDNLCPHCHMPITL